jgi:hypothetical protein
LVSRRQEITWPVGGNAPFGHGSVSALSVSEP